MHTNTGSCARSLSSSHGHTYLYPYMAIIFVLDFVIPSQQLQKTEEGYTQIYEAVSEFTDAIEGTASTGLHCSAALGRGKTDYSPECF